MRRGRPAACAITALTAADEKRRGAAMAGAAQAMEDIARGIVVAQPLEAAERGKHPLQPDKNRQIEARDEFRAPAQQEARRRFRRPVEEPAEISHGVAAQPLRVVDHDHERPAARAPLQILAEPAQPARPVLDAAFYPRLAGDRGDQFVEAQPGAAARDETAGHSELVAEAATENGLPVPASPVSTARPGGPSRAAISC